MAKYDSQTPYIASYVIIRREDKIAFLLRSNTQWMNGYYGLPSGKVEKNESALAAACREALEEIGIKVNSQALRFVHVMHRQNPDLDWIDIFFEADKFQGIPVNAEPEVHGELAWFNLEDLPENTVDYVAVALKSINNGEVYSQYGWHPN